MREVEQVMADRLLVVVADVVEVLQVCVQCVFALFCGCRSHFATACVFVIL